MWCDMECLAREILCQEFCRIGILMGDINDLLERNVPAAFYYHSKLR